MKRDKIEKEWQDPIVDEIRAARDQHARKFGYRLRAIYNDLKSKQKKWERLGFKFVHGTDPNGANEPGKKTGTKG